MAKQATAVEDKGIGITLRLDPEEVELVDKLVAKLSASETGAFVRVTRTMALRRAFKLGLKEALARKTA